MASTLDPGRALAEIYAAGLDGDRWRDALTTIIGMAGASGAQLLFTDARRQRNLTSAGIDPTENLRYNQHYGRFDPIPAKLAALAPGEILSCREAVSQDARRTAFFHEWADPNEISDAVFLKLSNGDGSLYALALGHPWRYEPFLTPRLHGFLDALAPHLVNALLIARKLEQTIDAADAAQSSLDALSYGWALVSDDGRLLSANRSALAILRQQDGLSLYRGVVTIADADANARFQRSVRAAAGLPDRVTDFGLPIAATRPSGTTSYLIRMTPYQTQESRLGPSSGRVTILITDPAREEDHLARLLKGRFGLTEAEAQVALKIRRGRGLRHVAAERRVSLSTARVHLQHVFEKTGTHRQSELVLLMERLRAAR